MPATEGATLATPARYAPRPALRPRPRRRSAARLLLLAGLTLTLVTVGAEAVHVLVGRNFHVILPGRCYRCAQLPPRKLERLLTEQGIRTVINLRGACLFFPWYHEECRVTHNLGVSQQDVCLSAGRLPAPSEIRRLVEVLDHADYPVVLHCRRGADRTGLVAALIVLLYTDASLDEGLRQLGPRYGHVALGRPAILGQFFELYEEWLRSRDLAHSRAAFREWVEGGYCPGPCRCRVEPVAVPDRFVCGRPTAVRARFHNTSVRPWRLRPGTESGIHGGCMLVDHRGRLRFLTRSGLFEAEVPPGGSVELTFAVVPPAAPGVYSLVLDMVDHNRGWFFQSGSEAFLHVLEVAAELPPADATRPRS